MKEKNILSRNLCVQIVYLITSQSFKHFVEYYFYINRLFPQKNLELSAVVNRFSGKLQNRNLKLKTGDFALYSQLFVVNMDFQSSLNQNVNRFYSGRVGKLIQYSIPKVVNRLISQYCGCLQIQFVDSPSFCQFDVNKNT